MEVSSDGVDYFRFPAITNVPEETQMGGFDLMDATSIHNFAGKYEVLYGTPFDLDAVGVIHDMAHLELGENQQKKIFIYPNLVREMLFVKAENMQHVEFYNLTGQEVKTLTEMEIDVNDLATGIYFVRVICKEKTFTERVIVR